ncbi:hypothetical protein Bbelb_428870 [Branchiostoma belcheri]|nr:hypothetical protein Bbelb_428870 [Branchiostoma belcheri]
MAAIISAGIYHRCHMTPGDTDIYCWAHIKLRSTFPIHHTSIPSPPCRALTVVQGRGNWGVERGGVLDCGGGTGVWTGEGVLEELECGQWRGAGVWRGARVWRGGGVLECGGGMGCGEGEGCWSVEGKLECGGGRGAGVWRGNWSVEREGVLECGGGNWVVERGVNRDGWADYVLPAVTSLQVHLGSAAIGYLPAGPAALR